MFCLFPLLLLPRLVFFPLASCASSPFPSPPSWSRAVNHDRFIPTLIKRREGGKSPLEMKKRCNGCSRRLRSSRRGKGTAYVRRREAPKMISSHRTATPNELPPRATYGRGRERPVSCSQASRQERDLCCGCCCCGQGCLRLSFDCNDEYKYILIIHAIFYCFFLTSTYQVRIMYVVLTRSFDGVLIGLCREPVWPPWLWFNLAGSMHYFLLLLFFSFFFLVFGCQ